MLEGMADARAEVRPSRFWVELNRKNLEQLQTSGYENFKQTLALNYFTWMLRLANSQFRFLRSRLPASAVSLSALRALLGRRHPFFSWVRSRRYDFLSQLLWLYAV